MTVEKEILKRVEEYRDYCLKLYKEYSEDHEFKKKWLNALDTTNIVLHIIEVVIKESDKDES